MKPTLFRPGTLGSYPRVEYRFMKHSGVTELTLQTFRIVEFEGGVYPGETQGGERRNSVFCAEILRKEVVG